MKLTEEEHFMFYRLIGAMIDRLAKGGDDYCRTAVLHLNHAQKTLDRMPR